jgi:vacuolar iron transporter family protein
MVARRQRVQHDLEHSHAPAIAAYIAQEARSGYLRDWIYGAINGSVTTFAIVAVVFAADLPAMVMLVLGLANLAAVGFAMAARNYRSTKADRNNHDRAVAGERKGISLIPDGKRELIRRTFAHNGFTGDKLERIVSVMTSDKALWARISAAKEYGPSPPIKSPAQAAVSTFTAFILFGLVPLVTYLLAGGLAVCIFATGCSLFVLGAVKSRYSLTKWWQSGLETFFLGTSSAALSFGVGYTLRLLLDTPLQ